MKDKGFTYGKVTYFQKDKFEFSTNPEFKKPKSLFKYYSMSDYNVEAITQNYLFASHPFDLNDILDSKRELLYLTKNHL